MKSIIRVVAIIISLPLTLLFVAASKLMDNSQKDDLFAAFSQFYSLFPGKLGVYLRIGFYRFTMNRCHEDAHISFGSLFSQVDTDIGASVYIGPQCNIGACTIADETLLGSGVHVASGRKQHNFEELEVPIRMQGGELNKIQIGKNCWIGNGALILANVGDECIVAAGAVVVTNINAKSIVAGNPAKVIKLR